MSNGKWVHNQNEDGVWITHDEFDSKEEAVIAGRQEYDKNFFVGKTKEVGVPILDADYVLEILGEQVYDQVGEVAEDYLGAEVRKEEEQELEKSLNDGIQAWMKKHNHLPEFWTIENVEEVEIV